MFVETELPGVGIGGESGPAYVPLASMPDAGGKDSSASGSLPTFNLSPGSTPVSDDSTSTGLPDTSPAPASCSASPESCSASPELHSDTGTPDPESSRSAPSGSTLTAPGSHTAPNAGTSIPASSWIPSPSALPAPESNAESTPRSTPDASNLCRST